MSRTGSVAAALLALAACSDDPGGSPARPDAADTATPDTSVGDAGSDAAVEDDPWPPTGPAPERFDCRAAQGPPPERTSPVPWGCVSDPACLDRMVVGHRGMGGNWAYLAPENSLASLRAAILAGLDGVEIDVRHAQDGTLVVIHDDTVNRTFHGTGEVDELGIDDLRSLEFRTTSTLVGTLPGDFSCERLPTFAEVLELARGRLFLDVDVKTNRSAAVAEAIRDADALDYAFFSSGSQGKVVAARAAVPDLAVQVRPDTPEALEDWVDALDRAPEIFEMDFGELEPVLERIRELEAKPFVDSFPQDVAALTTRSFDGFEDIWSQGAQIIQSDAPLLLLHSMGRHPRAR